MNIKISSTCSNKLKKYFLNFFKKIFTTEYTIYCTYLWYLFT